MPTRFLSDAERRRLSGFPAELTQAEVATHFTLTTEDLTHLSSRRGEANRLGFALQLCTLRYLGFVPDDLQGVPPGVLTSLAGQLQMPATALTDYATRDQTRTDHRHEAMTLLGFRSATEDDLADLTGWLTERALEHDQALLLLQLASERLRAHRLVRPGITVVERLVATARERADSETYQRLAALLTPDHATALDRLLVLDPALGRTRLAWLRAGATSPTPGAILGELEKLTYLRALGAGDWDLSALPPNRRRRLAQIARRSTNQALQRTTALRRYPALLAFCADSIAELTDELVELFDRALARSDARARHALEELRRGNARAVNDKVRLFIAVGRILLDPDAEAREKLARVDTQIGFERLRAAVVEAEQLARPADDNYFDLLASRYAYLREFTPAVLAGLDLHANAAAAGLLEAVTVLRQVNAERRRRLPPEAPCGFVPTRWRPYVITDDGRLSRRYWELCLLSELRAALRAGDVWVTGSRRYANPESYLIPRERWSALRSEVLALLGGPDSAEVRLAVWETELQQHLEQLGRTLARGDQVRLDKGELVAPRLTAEDLPEATVQLTHRLAERLPRVELADLLIEVDRWCGFSRHFTHAGGATARTPELTVHLYAALLAQACNFGLTTMAENADLTYRQLAWTTEWYLREETLQAASTAIVNYQHGLPLAQAWGGGTLSSSDGQRFPVAVKSPVATALPRYFGLGSGITAYTHVSDQHSTYATKVIPATVRDATYVLDGLLDNETELPILEHTTDTAGYTDLVFALFDLLGLQFAPRLRDLGDQQLYRLGPAVGDRQTGSLLHGTIKRHLIVDRWDDLLRVAGSLKLGWVTTSLLISRLQASPRQNALTRALQEYGRVVKTLFILRYLDSEEYRRRINRQLNRGESLHALRRFLFFAEDGKVRRRQREDQTNQALCLTLVTNAIVTWNTVYLAAVLEQLRAEGISIEPEGLAHLSPTTYGHINPYGKYHFDLETGLGRAGLRPLREPDAGAA